MSIGSWQPTTTLNTTIEQEVLNELLAWLVEHENELAEVELASKLPSLLLQKTAGWISQDKEAWQTAIVELKDESVWLLAKFYALAEEQLDEFSAQEKSPSITLFKTLKKRGANLTKSHTRELKSLSSNRYIPFGKAIL